MTATLQGAYPGTKCPDREQVAQLIARFPPGGSELMPGGQEGPNKMPEFGLRIAFIITLVALAILVCHCAQAAGYNIVAGPSMTSGHRSTVAVFASVFREPPVDGHFRLEPIATLGWIRDHHTYREHLHHSVYLAGAGVRLLSPGVHWFVGVQLAATSDRTDALSSPLEFIDSAGWQDGRLTLMLRHVSNGHIVGGSPNMGETMLLAGIRL